MAEKSSAGYREQIQTAAAVIGVATALLYVFGYLAERVHWNLYGHIEVPTDHVEFLYRGGNVVLSCLAAWMLYLIEPKSMKRWCLLLSFVVLLLAGRRAAKSPGRKPLSHLSLYACLCILLALSLHDLVGMPEAKENLLFTPDVGRDRAALEGYSGNYIGLLGLWLILFMHSGWVLRRTAKPDGAAVRDWALGAPYAGDETPTAGDKSQWVGKRWWQAAVRLLGRPPSVVKGVSAAATALLLALLPIIYGIFKYPNVYPLVSVLPSKDMPDESKQGLARAGAMALLFTTGDDYVLYAKRPEPVVLKLKKSEVSMIKVLKLADVTDANAFAIEGGGTPAKAASSPSPSPAPTAAQTPTQ